MSATVFPLRAAVRAPLPSLAPAGELAGPMRMLEQAGLGIALVQQRRITSCNQRFAELYGFDVPAQMLGSFTRDLYANADDFHALGAISYPVMAVGRPFKIELPQRRCNGQLFWARLTGTLLDPADTARGSVWIIDDIDARKSAERALASVRERHHLILDNVAFLRERNVTQCNRAFEQLLGWEPGELSGRSSRDWYLSDADWEAAGQHCDEPFRQGNAFEGELVLRHCAGHPIECEVRAKAIDPEQPTLGSIWIMLDITARKAAERALHDTQVDLERQVRERTEALNRTVSELEQRVSEQKQAEARIQRLALVYLRNFPVGKLKIDRSFVRDIGRGPCDRAIVEAIIRMAASLGMRTVAEGMETREQLAFLRERGCNAMQGYLLARPLPAADFARFLRERTQEG